LPRCSSPPVTMAAACLLTLGCAHRTAAPPPTVAVLPAEVLGVPDAEAEALQRALVAQLEQSPQSIPVDSEPIERALAGQPSSSDCHASDSCLTEIGRQSAADLVLSITVAGLGEMRLVRSRLVEVESGLTVQDLQEHADGGVDNLERYGQELAELLFPPEPAVAVLRRWWFWTAVTGGLGASAGLAALAARPAPDDTVVHLGDL
jgi:hypothetical protein